MKVTDLFPSKYVRGEDLEGKRPTVTVKGWSIEEMGKDKEENPVLWFNGTAKGLVLNKTNAMKIADLYGQEMDDWIGKRIILYAEPVRIGGVNRMAIKVAEEVPPPPQPKQPPLPATPEPKVKEETRVYLQKIAKLASQHDSLFNEPSDVGQLRELMMGEADEDWEPMPVVPAPGKSHSMYGYLLECIDEAVGIDGCAEPILSYLLGRVVTGLTPATVGHKFLIDDLKPDGEGEWVDTLLAVHGVIKDNA